MITIKKQEKLDNGYVRLSIECPQCKQLHTIDIHNTRMKYLQKVDNETYRCANVNLLCPPDEEYSADQKELLITGICSECWDKLFPEDED